MRGWRSPALIAVLLMAAAVAFVFFRSAAAPPDRRAEAARLMNELMVGKVPIGGPFTLTDQHGKTRSLADFRGRPVLLYFGYTFCPDVCPTDLLAIGELIRSLGPRGDELQPVFITLDPARDKPEIIGAYTTSFHPRFVALHGSEEEIRRIATAYKIFYEKVTPPGSGTYLLDHAAFVFLLDREGRYVGLFPPGTPPQRMAAMVEEQLAK